MLDFLNGLNLSNFLGKKYGVSLLNSPQQYGNIIKDMINQYSHNTEVINAANQITSGCSDDLCRVHRIYNWVQDNIDFQDDPDKYERLIAPDLALQTIKQYGKLYEDCDSMTALMGSLLKALGIQVKITMAQTDNSNDLSHVYIRAYINQNGQTYIVPMDTTYKDNQIGWEYPTANRIEI